jgi:hypothetical protein
MPACAGNGTCIVLERAACWVMWRHGALRGKYSATDVLTVLVTYAESAKKFVNSCLMDGLETFLIYVFFDACASLVSQSLILLGPRYLRTRQKRRASTCGLFGSTTIYKALHKLYWNGRENRILIFAPFRWRVMVDGEMVLHTAVDAR